MSFYLDDLTLAENEFEGLSSVSGRVKFLAVSQGSSVVDLNFITLFGHLSGTFLCDLNLHIGWSFLCLLLGLLFLCLSSSFIVGFLDRFFSSSFNPGIFLLLSSLLCSFFFLCFLQGSSFLCKLSSFLFLSLQLLSLESSLLFLLCLSLCIGYLFLLSQSLFLFFSLLLFLSNSLSIFLCL